MQLEKMQLKMRRNSVAGIWLFKIIPFALNYIPEAIHLKKKEKYTQLTDKYNLKNYAENVSDEFTYGIIYRKQGHLILYAACSLFQALQLAKVNPAY